MSFEICVHVFLFGIHLKVKLLGHISTLVETNKLSKWLYQFILLLVMCRAPSVPHPCQQGIISWGFGFWFLVWVFFFFYLSLGNNFWLTKSCKIKILEWMLIYPLFKNRIFITFQMERLCFVFNFLFYYIVIRVLFVIFLLHRTYWSLCPDIWSVFENTSWFLRTFYEKIHSPTWIVFAVHTHTDTIWLTDYVV